MDLNLIVDIIQNIGFPIVCVGGLFWYVNKREQDHKAERNEWAEERKEWMITHNTSSKAIEANTQVMHQILEVLRPLSQEH